jgi:hypothetical protein
LSSGPNEYPVGYLPPKIYAFMVKLCEEYNLSMKEVQRIILNKVFRDLGFECPHERIGYAPDKEPFCKDCWTRLRKVIREPYRIGTSLIKNEINFIEKETFLDEFYRDLQKQKEADARKKKEQEHREPSSTDASE